MSSSSAPNSVNMVDGVDLNDPTAVAIAAASGTWGELDRASTCMYNFFDVSDVERNPGESSKQLVSRIKKRAGALFGVSRAFKDTEQVLSAERCAFKSFSDDEEIMATTFEPLKDRTEITPTAASKLDKTLEAHRAKFNYMAIDSIRVAVTSLMHQGDSRECIMYLCDRRFKDPLLGAIALIGFTLPGMQTHVYKTGRMMAFSRKEAVAADRLQLYLYVKGAKLERTQNTPITVNVRTSLIFGSNAENLLKCESQIDTDMNIVSFMAQNQDLFGWLEAAQGGGYVPRSVKSATTHTSNSVLLHKWSNPVGSVSQRIASRVIFTKAIDAGTSHEETDVVGGNIKCPSSIGKNLRIGVAQASIQNTKNDSVPYNLADFVQDGPIAPVVASLESFMSSPSISQTIPLINDQFTRPIYSRTFEWNATDVVGTSVFQLELPGDVVGPQASSLFSDTMQRAFCFSSDFELSVLLTGNESYMGALKIVTDQLRRFHEAKQDDARVFHSMPGKTIFAKDSDGIKIPIEFMSIHKAVSAHDSNSHNALSRVEARVVTPLSHISLTSPVLSITIQVFAKNVKADYMMWRSLETTFPTANTSLPSAVGDNFGRLRASQSEILTSQQILGLLTERAFLGTAKIQQDTGARVKVAEFALHPMSSRNVDGTLLLSQLAALSAMYAFWRGSLILTFEINCSASTRGKLIVSVTPKGGVAIAGITASHQGYGAEFDLGTSSTRSFTMPFVSTDEWESIGDDGIMSAFEGIWDCPVANLLVLHPITSIAESTPSVDIRCYLHPGPDFQLRGRRHIGLRAAARPLSVAQASPILSQVDFSLMASVAVDATEESVIVAVPCAPWYSKEEVDYTLLQNPLHWASRMFTLWRGDIEYRFVIKEEALGDGWQSPISVWHNPNTQLSKCKITKITNKKISKETYHGKKISLMQLKSVDIVAVDDRRFSWRLCKILDTTKEQSSETASPSVTQISYTGHPPMSSQTGVVCIKFPRNSIKGKLKVYSKPGENFEFRHLGGVPSLQVSQMVKYRKPFQDSVPDVFVTPAKESSVKELGFRSKVAVTVPVPKLAVGKAQGIVSKLANFGSLWRLDEEEVALNSELQKMAVEVSGEIEPLQDEGWAKRKLNEIISSVSAKLIEASTSILSNAATRAISTLFDVMIGKVRGVLASLIDSISGAFRTCLGDPKCLCLIGISISAVLGYCTLKLVESSVPDALGIFKALMMVAITSISALYWPKAAISIVTKYEEQFKEIENYCSTVYKHIFLGVTDDKLDGAPPAKACATNFEDLAHGKAQAGGKSFLELAGLIAYIRLCVTLCKAMNTSFLEPFTPSNMEKQCRSVSGISMGVRTLCDFKDYIYRMIVGGITPTSSYVKVSSLTGFDIREWFEEVENLTLQETRYTQMGSEEKVKQVRSLYDKGVSVMGKLTMIDSPHLSRVCERSFRLCKELLDETHRCKGASSTRIDPFHVSLYGSPGVGKSFVMGKLLDDVLDFMNEPQADRCYSKTPNEEYWSGYIGQTAVKCDDLGQDLSKGFSPTYNQIIQMKTNNCFIVPMADLANKGRTFTSKYIFSTTNVPGCGTKHGLADPGAFMRRRNVFVKVETEGEMIPGSTNHMRFTLLDPLNPDERIMKYPARMKYIDFLCVCVAEARVYFETQELVMKTLNGTTKNQEEPSRDIVSILEELGGGVIEGILEKRKELLAQFGVMDPPPFDAADLEPGKAQASLCFSTDAYGNPLKNIFVELFGKLRDDFVRATKQEMPDDVLTGFGASLTLGEPTVFGYENQYGIHNAKDSELMSSFFTFVFERNLVYKDESEFLRHLDVLSSMGVLRLVDAVTVATKGHKKVLSFSNIYDNEAFEQLGVLERLVFHLVLATRAAKKGRIYSIRQRLSDWFASARALSCNILEELPSPIKMLLVLATSVGSLYLAFKGLSGIGSMILGFTGNFATKEEDFEMISLNSLMGQAKSKGRNFITSGDELTTRLSRMMSRASLATGRAQGGRSYMDTCETLLARQGQITNMATGLHLVATDLGGGFLLAPLHTFAGAEKDDIFRFQNGADFYFAFEPHDVSQLAEYDACIIRTDAIPMRSSIVSIFAKESQVELLVDMNAHFVCGPWKVPFGGEFISEQTVAKRIASFKYFMDEKLYMAINGWSSPFKTEEGQCGSCLVSTSDKLDGKVFCSLVAGTYDRVTGNYVSTYVPITCDMIKRSISLLTGVEFSDSQSSVCDSPVSVMVAETIKIDQLVSSKPGASGKFGVFGVNDSIGIVDIVGRTFPETTPKSITKSTIIPSLIQPYMPRKPLTEPAILDARDVRLGENRYDPMIDGIKKYEEQARPIKISWRNQIIESFAEQMKDWETFMVREGYMTSDLPMSVIINGIDGIEYYEPLNMSTSEGYPLILDRPKDAHGKEYLFETMESGERRIKSAKLEAHYECYGHAIQNTEPFPLICIECPKDERRALDKIYEKPKTRLFSILPVEFNMHARRLFLDFNVFVMANRHKHGIMVGINPHSREWSDLAISLASFSPYGFNGDFANFDGMFHPSSFSMVSELANIFYGNFLSKERDNLTRMLTNRFSLMKGAVLRVPGGGPSGFPMTVIFNSFINLFYLQSAWIMLARINGRQDISHPCNFPKYVRACVYGDDNIVAIKMEVLPWYNLQTVSEALFDYFGVTMTDGAKNKASEAEPYGKILEFDFLKRHFKADELIPSLFHAPLHKRSIEEQVYWIREGGNSLELLEANIENALYEAHHHGREYYEELKSQINKAMNRAGYISFVAPSYLMCRQRWLQQDLGEVATSSLPSHVGLLKEATKNHFSALTGQEEIKVVFEEIDNGNGGTTKHGNIQQILPNIFIGPTRVFETKYGSSLFNLVCDNSLSKGQTRYGVKHGIQSLSKPDFAYISESLPCLTVDNFRLICLDPIGGELALATALCLLHAAGIINTKTFTMFMRIHIKQWKHVLQAYFRVCETFVSKEWHNFKRDIKRLSQDDVGCSRTTPVCGRYLTMDGQLPLHIKALDKIDFKKRKNMKIAQDEEFIIQID